MTLSAGTVLGFYEVLSPLGAGGMGEVYRARDTRLEREVAIKVLPQHLSSNEEFRARFGREAKTVAALSHPNILAIYDVGHQDGVAYVVTELLDGETLRQTLMGGTVSHRKAMEIAIALADGLAAAHAKGVVHRDLKPENIFLTSDGVVKILDFGLARQEAAGGPPQEAAHTPTVTLNTTPGTVMGTINYMSPEQIRALRADARSDVFSFGCVLYEMLTGQKAFAGETPADTITAILREPPKSIRSIRHDVGPELERVIDRCLEKKPESRFQSSHDMAFTLRSILANSGAAIPRESPRPRRRTGLVATLVVAPGVLVWWLFIIQQEAARKRFEGVVIRSLAVLPLENVSRDPEQEYFVDGMTEALISDLAKIGGLKVISRTSAMRYKATTKSLPEVARELGVDGVVEGSVLRVGERVRITAQLIHAASDQHLWTESYDRDLRDVLRLHSELARAIAQEIKVSLTPQEQSRVGAARRINPAAHEAYLKGRFHWNKRTPDGLQKAVEYFEQAIALAPDWSLGHAGLADAYVLMPAYRAVPTSEAVPKARAAAERALQLDESLGEPHATLAIITNDVDWDWRAAEQGFKRALALSPNYAQAHSWYAMHLMLMGRYEEAVDEAVSAQSLDPLAMIITITCGWVHYTAGEFERAKASARGALEIDGNFGPAHSILSRSLCLQHRYAEAIAEAREAARLSGNAARDAATLAAISAMSGDSQSAHAILDELLERSRNGFLAPPWIALIHAGLGDRDNALRWLDRAFKERDANFLDVLADPLLTDMRSDPRFVDLVRRVGLPPLPPLRSSIPASSLSEGGQRGVTGERITLAVLPFANDSGDPELLYLSDGVAETLINGFSRLVGLRTVPRSKAFAQRGVTDPAAAGKSLSATAVLTGRVLKRGDNLTIQAELTDVAEGRQLWGERYQRKLADLVEIERDIATDITDALRLSLTGEEQASLSRGYSRDSEAYRLYLQGRYWWAKRTKEGFDNALRLLNESVRLDASFALAYTGMADTYSLLPLYGWMTPEDARAQARAAAEKALRLDDQLAEAHTSMGMVRFYLEWDFGEADREFQRAEQLNPRWATTQQWWGLCLGVRGRFADAKAKLRRAIELDPLAPIFTHNLAWIQMWEHDWHAALATARSGLDFAPDFFLMLQSAGLSHVALGHSDEAIAALRKSMQMSGSASFAGAYLAYGLGRTGHRAECQAMIDEWLDLDKSRYVPPTDLALMYIGLGDMEKAIAWLEKGYEKRDVWMTFLSVLPFWDPLRGDPRFVSLLRRIGLPELEPPDAPRDPGAPIPNPK